MEKPGLADKFDVFEADGINVYIGKDIKLINGSVHIFLRRFLWIKELAVDGLRINY